MRFGAAHLTRAGSAAVIGVCAVVGLTAWAQQERKLGYSDTPMLPGGKWHVHDGTRPQPKIIDPGTASTEETPGKPPSDAIVLFDGKDLSHWKSDKGGPAQWDVENGVMTIKPGSGSIATTDQ